RRDARPRRLSLVTTSQNPPRPLRPPDEPSRDAAPVCARDSQATARPVHCPRLVMLDQSIENLHRRQALMAVDCDEHVADGQRLAAVGFFSHDASGQLDGVQIGRDGDTFRPSESKDTCVLAVSFFCAGISSISRREFPYLAPASNWLGKTASPSIRWASFSASASARFAIAV